MSTLDTQLGKDRFVLAFYGVDPAPEEAEAFFLLSTQWLTDLGYPPDKLAVGRKGRSGGKVGDFQRTRARIDKTGFSEVESFDMHASMPEAVVPGLDYYASVSFASPIRDGGYSVIAVPSAVPTTDAWLAVAAKIVQGLRPAYGIGFRRELSLGPVWYALGVCYGGDNAPTGPAYEAALQISRWSYRGMVKQVWRDGLLRDVYPWNFLTPRQLVKRVGEKSLEEWIRHDTRRGTLQAIADNVLLWEVDEEVIPELHRELYDAGVIFDWR